MLNDAKKVLVIGPHIDDVELGAGGTILRLKKMDKEVFVLVLCSCKDVLKENNLDQNLFMEECMRSSEFLGIKKDHIFFHDIETKNFPMFKKEIRNIFHTIGKQISPDLVIGPSIHDFHQDHSTAAKEMRRAFVSGESIISYEIGKNNLIFRPEIFVDITSFLEGKIRTLGFYQSQKKYFKKPYFDEDFIRGLARVRGVQSNLFKYAEAFEVVRLNI
jgi:LmbE family N-acetylglucosaminyl deacetylase